MACLSNEQIDFIRRELKDQKVSRSFLYEEWLDHICCDVETLINKGLSFDEAFSRVAGHPGGNEVKEAHKAVQSFLNHRYVGIKKLLLFAFLVFSASWIINISWGSHWVGLVSFIILSLVYLRISFDFYKKRFVGRVNILLSGFSLLGFIGTLSGILLIFLYRNYGLSTRGHGVDLTVFGWFFFSLVCLIYYTRDYRSSIEEPERKKTRWFIFLSMANVFLAALSIATFPLYPRVQSYLFHLIIFILAFNVIAILILILTRSMKNTLVLSLVIGSFMIVFIHSHFRHRLPGGKPKLYELTLQLSVEPESGDSSLYISMYFDQYPDMPLTLPLKKMGDRWMGITMPSYAYRGYLIYGTARDSIPAREFFRQSLPIDSIEIKIPGRTEYQIEPSNNNTP